MSKRGRPTQYNPDMCTILDNAEGDDFGAGTVTDICKLLGVPYTNVYQWMNKHDDFKEAVMRVRERADQLVVSAMRKRATGYTIENPVEVTEKTTRWVRASDLYDLEAMEDLGHEPDDEIEVEVRDVKERKTTQFTHIPADANAAKFWLTNRQRKDWTERKEVDVKGSWGELVDAILKGDQTNDPD